MAPVQVNPRSGTHPVWHPILLPLSHNSNPALMESPQKVAQTDGEPIAPVQV
jgi:hypothetical protein